MNRWIRLSAAVVAMIMIGNLQYAWTLFVQPMMAGTGWKLSQAAVGLHGFYRGDDLGDADFRMAD